MFRRRSPDPPKPQTRTLDLDGRAVPVTVRPSRRAKRLILRVAFDTGDVVVTIPARSPVDHGFVMARTRTDWILERLDRLPPRVPFEPGAVIPLLGEDHRIVHDPSRRRGVRHDDGHLRVAGSVDGVAAAVARWLRDEARRETVERSAAKAAHLGARVGRIGVRDTRTRWGSCSQRGNLSYSWRLIMTPAFVLDYVVAHEVSHLKERGHGPAFWRTVATLTDTVDSARAWLRKHGPGLHRYG